jgi:diguanylate cyclase (GGDEF)-like protein
LKFCWSSLLTVSIGVAALEASRRDIEELIAAADVALYEAKHAGRNCDRMSFDPAVREEIQS